MVRWTSPAKRDLKRIYDYIAEDSVFYAKKVVEDIVSRSEILENLPEIGRMVPELGNPDIRELIVYSYRLVYRIKEGNVQILTIIHGKRDFIFAFEKGK